MPNQDKRQYPRFDSLNLLSYAVYDTEGGLIRQGMGRTLNVSLSGILIETHVRVDPDHRVVLAVGFGEELVELEGKPVYCRAAQNRMFETGIDFVRVDDPHRAVIAAFVEAFKAAKPADGRSS